MVGSLGVKTALRVCAGWSEPFLISQYHIVGNLMLGLIIIFMASSPKAMTSCPFLPKEERERGLLLHCCCLLLFVECVLVAHRLVFDVNLLITV